MSFKVGIDFGTSNSGVAVYDGQRVRLLPVDPKNVLPEVIKTVLYITKDYRTYLGQEAVENYYRDNVNRQRRFVKQWAGEIEYRGADMFYMRDIFVYVDELKPGRCCNISRPRCARTIIRARRSLNGFTAWAIWRRRI
jgi:hypothetical chaperone protein